MKKYANYVYMRLVADAESVEQIEKATTEQAYKTLAKNACWYCWALFRDNQYKAPETVEQVTALIKEKNA